MKIQFTDEEFKRIMPNINDVIVDVDCKRFDKCCEKPQYINQMGCSYCLCMSCGKKCYKCKG